MRLIDADALIDESLKEGAYGYVDTYQIANAPTVDAEPVRHGHWVDIGSEVVRVCSCCHDDVLYAVMYNLKGEEISLKYCPNCGADMRGGR